MTRLKIEPVTQVKSTLGEAPVWDEQRQSISWVDIVNGKIHQWSTADQNYSEIDILQMIGTIALCHDGNYIAALKNGFAFIDRQAAVVKIISNPEPLLNNRFNDGKCDPAGRFWAGTLSLTEEPHAGSLYLLDSDLRVSKKRSEMTIPNGMAWSNDHKTFYHIDTPTRKVMAYDFDKRLGLISKARVVIQFKEHHGFPDGMTIDKEGMLWIAHWDGWLVSRWNPLNGEQLFSISMPVANVTSCTFGGINFTDLYITTAIKGLTKEQLSHQPLAGSLLVIRDCGYEGLPAYRFKQLGVR